MLTLYHSFIQSHLNYCSLIWGLGSKNSIRALFICQKKAMRTLMPGYVNYYYNKTTKEPPCHTKQAFKDNDILTVYSLILKNMILFLYKLKYHAQLIPYGIQDIFPDLENLDNPTARLVTEENSMFIKGRRLFSEVMSDFVAICPVPLTLLSLNSYKIRLKSYMISLQSQGSSDEWIPENFRLCTQQATRKSPRLNPNDSY